MKLFGIAFAVALFPIIIKAQTLTLPSINSPTDFQTVKISSFTAVKSNFLAQLNWVTASEENNKGFVIERSSDGTVFNQIGFVTSEAAGGNSSQNLTYIYFDANTPEGINYYRLEQTGFDDKPTYSPVVKVIFGADDNTIVVYPNPAKDRISIDGLKGNESIQLYSTTGQLVKKEKAGGPTSTLDISNINTGVYRLTITDDAGKKVTQKIIKE